MGLTSVKDASAYIIYMMLGSYFKKAVCVSSSKESQLKIAYLEQKKDNQIKQEERCENYIEQRIIPVMPQEIFEDMVEVRFLDENNHILVEFRGYDWEITMWAEEDNRYINYYYTCKGNNMPKPEEKKN